MRHAIQKSLVKVELLRSPPPASIVKSIPLPPWLAQSFLIASRLMCCQRRSPAGTTESTETKPAYIRIS
jgi:hypothetical protein